MSYTDIFGEKKVRTRSVLTFRNLKENLEKESSLRSSKDNYKCNLDPPARGPLGQGEEPNEEVG